MKALATQLQALRRLGPAGVTSPVASLVIVLLFAFFIPIGNSPGNVAMAVLAVTVLPFIRVSEPLRYHPVIVAGFLWMGYVLAMAIRAELSGFPGSHFLAIDNYIFAGLAPFVAVQVAVARRAPISFERLAVAILAAAVLGGTIRLLWKADFAAGLELFRAYADGGGGNNRNYLSILTGLLLLVAGTLLAIVAGDGGLAPRWRWGGSALLLAVLGLAFLALVAMESRTNWVATTVAAAVWALVLFRAAHRQRLLRLRTLLGVGLVFLVLAAVAILRFGDAIAARLSTAGGLGGNVGAFIGILTGALDRGSLDLAAYDPRVYLFLAGRELVAERPLFGWGPDVAPLVADHVGVKAWEHLTHFHNAYLEFLIGLGVVGVAGFLVVAGVLASAFRGGEPAPSPRRPPLVALAAAIFTYAAVIGFAESANRVELVTQTLVLLLALLLARGAIGRAVDASFAARPGPQ